VNIILGGRPGFPVHLDEAEKFLLNKELDENTINLSKEIAIKTSEVQNDMRLSMEYRKNLSGVLTKRSLIKIKNDLNKF